MKMRRLTLTKVVLSFLLTIIVMVSHNCKNINQNTTSKNSASDTW
jgi:hypothetical protein